MPADLAAAIAAVPAAQAMLDVLAGTDHRYALIHRPTTVSRPEARRRRIAESVEMLARHGTPYPQRAPHGSVLDALSLAAAVRLETGRGAQARRPA